MLSDVPALIVLILVVISFLIGFLLRGFLNDQAALRGLFAGDSSPSYLHVHGATIPPGIKSLVVQLRFIHFQSGTPQQIDALLIPSDFVVGGKPV